MSEHEEVALLRRTLANLLIDYVCCLASWTEQDPQSTTVDLIDDWRYQLDQRDRIPHAEVTFERDELAVVLDVMADPSVMQRVPA